MFDFLIWNRMFRLVNLSPCLVMHFVQWWRAWKALPLSNGSLIPGYPAKQVFSRIFSWAWKLHVVHISSCHISVPVLIRLPVSLDFEITIISQLVGASTSSYGNYCTVFIWLVAIKFIFMSYPKLFNLSASLLQTSPQQELLRKVTFLLSTSSHAHQTKIYSTWRKLANVPIGLHKQISWPWFNKNGENMNT